MNEKQRVKISKLMSLVLRHRPEVIGLELDPQGWVEIETLLIACEKHRKGISRNQLIEVVESCDKQRFAISENGQRIRASQGHSTKVELGYEPVVPPNKLFHGTVARFLPVIRQSGLKRMKRHHVHLSTDYDTAVKVGDRRGSAIILTIDSGQMHADGILFFCSANGVWLVDHVPPQYISESDQFELK